LSSLKTRPKPRPLPPPTRSTPSPPPQPTSSSDPRTSPRSIATLSQNTKEGTIVNNESSEIIRFLNTGFNSILPDGQAKELDLYPEELRAEIDELNEWVYDDVNNGVYKSGFATKQDAYETAVTKLEEALHKLEDRLSDGRQYLVGDRLTEADVR
jgi:putative glutathione S-transferase